MENPDPCITLRRDDDVLIDSKVVDSLLPGKASYLVITVTVPQTDTGRQVEYTKALERTLVKELGKLTP